MNFECTPTTTKLSVSLAFVKALLRVTHDLEDPVIASMIRTAALEVEGYTDLALLTQGIAATTGEDPGGVIALPVGPVVGAVATVETIAVDGTATARASGFWLDGAR